MIEITIYPALLALGAIKITEAIVKHRTDAEDKKIKVYDENGKTVVEMGKAYFKEEEELGI